ncbi:MAG TPA: HTH domain-containing protein, partial [Anaeromyxobacteraceae bacterium]|nr:HTH domain-containing protein [Anaeromyxobacteraceae bacterium]
MTFTEAAIEVLRREGKPLHFTKIAEIAAREDLLDHVGKIPEETMAGQLVAHCRLPKADRRVIAVQHGTFALVEWGLDEDPAGIENLVEAPPADELPYRGRERHPIPSREVARASGRGEGRGRRREEAEERRGKRFPPPSEVAYEILAGAGKPLPLVEIATQGAERVLMPDAFVRDLGSLRAALLEDNRRREAAGRKPLFELEGETVTLVAQPEPGERVTGAPARAPAGAVELRKAALAALRRRMRDCDGPTLEHLAAALLERMGYQELKVVKRGREHAVYTARKQLGAASLRHAIRVLRAHGDVTRRDVQDLRRDISNYGAQIGVVIGTGDAQREARGEAASGGQLPVILLCGEALPEAATEAGIGCRAIVVPEVEEAWFREAAAKGAEEETARRARREERDRREGRREERRREPEPAVPKGEVVLEAEPAEGTQESEPPPPMESSGEGRPAIIEVPATLDEGPAAGEPGDDLEDEEEGADEEGSEAGAPAGAEGAAGPGTPEGGEGRRRRRRRRRRRGGR